MMQQRWHFLHRRGNYPIYERVAYRRATSEGATVAEYAKDQQAINEMNQFFNEI